MHNSTKILDFPSSNEMNNSETVIICAAFSIKSGQLLNSKN